MIVLPGWVSMLARWEDCIGAGRWKVKGEHWKLRMESWELEVESGMESDRKTFGIFPGKTGRRKVLNLTQPIAEARWTSATYTSSTDLTQT